MVGQSHSPAPNSHNWLRQYCSVRLVGMFEQTEQCFDDLQMTIFQFSDLIIVFVF